MPPTQNRRHVGEDSASLLRCPGRQSPACDRPSAIDPRSATRPKPAPRCSATANNKLAVIVSNTSLRLTMLASKAIKQPTRKIPPPVNRPVRDKDFANLRFGSRRANAVCILPPRTTNQQTQSALAADAATLSIERVLPTGRMQNSQRRGLIQPMPAADNNDQKIGSSW